MEFTSEQIAEIAELTSINEHTLARIRIATILENLGLGKNSSLLKEVQGDLNLVAVGHMLEGHLSPDLSRLRSYVDHRLKILLQYVSNGGDVWRAL